MVQHVPVLPAETIENLVKDIDGSYLDCTAGHGGHIRLILNKLSPKGKVFGIDQDQEAILFIKKNFSEKEKKRLFLIKENFCNLKDISNFFSFGLLSGILFDLGFSAGQIYDSERGFSYRLEGPLDMRMNRKQSLKAEEIVNEFSTKELELIFRNYGEEKYSRLLAEKIFKIRQKSYIKTTKELLKIIKETLPAKALGKKHPGKKIFQALRIAVNNEFDVLKKALFESPSLLKKNGRLAIICYHSLEEKIVKNSLSKNKDLELLFPKLIFPSQEEIFKNPSSRSARMLIYQKK